MSTSFGKTERGVRNVRTAITRDYAGDVLLSVEGDNAPEEILRKYKMLEEQLFLKTETKTPPKLTKKEEV